MDRRMGGVLPAASPRESQDHASFHLGICECSLERSPPGPPSHAPDVDRPIDHKCARPKNSPPATRGRVASLILVPAAPSRRSLG